MHATPPLGVLERWGVVRLAEELERELDITSITVVSVDRALVPLLAVALLSTADDG